MSRNMRWLVPVLLCALFAFAVFAAGGSVSDPLISLSYLPTVFTDKVMSYANAKEADLNADSLAQKALADAARKKAGIKTADELAQAIADAVIRKIKANNALLFNQSLSLSKGDKIVGAAGAGFILTKGTGQIAGPSGAQVVNINAGASRAPGDTVSANTYYMIMDDNASGLVVTSDTATVLLADGARKVPAYKEKYGDYATALNYLGLFLGTQNGYELNRTPQRQEALIMLIRLLGEEADALGHADDSPFTDLTNWADGRKYVAYGYAQGYTNGVWENAFAPTMTASSDMYITFVLRALGYDDKAGDFVWNSTAGSTAVRLGLLTQAQLDEIQSVGLMRDHVVLISFRALGTPLKGQSEMLADKLISAGLLTQAQLDTAQTLIK